MPLFVALSSLGWGLPAKDTSMMVWKIDRTSSPCYLGMLVPTMTLSQASKDSSLAVPQRRSRSVDYVRIRTDPETCRRWSYVMAVGVKPTDRLLKTLDPSVTADHMQYAC